MKKKLLSLLTLLVCVCSGAWADFSSTTSGGITTLTWDFAEYENNTITNPDSHNYNGIIFKGGTNNETLTKNGFKINGNTGNGTRYASYTPSNNGTITVYAKANGTSNARFALIATVQSAISTDPVAGTNNCIAVSKNLNGTDSDKNYFSADVTAQTTYYIEARQGITITKIIFTYNSSTEKYTVTFNAGSNGTCTTTSLTEASGGAGVTLPAVAPNTNYIFNGWYTAATEGTKAGNAGDTYKPSADITLYAQYSAQAAASITTQPSNVSVAQGKTATLSVVAAGTPAPAYQWYSCSDANMTGATPINGATSASYSPSTTTIGTSYFYVVVSNGVGEPVASNVVSLTVVESITIGLEQGNDNTPIEKNGTTYKGTLAAATYRSLANVTVAEVYGSLCQGKQSERKTTGPDGDYWAENCFRKNKDNNEGDSKWMATEWIGYTVTLAQGHKMSLTNLKATLWDANSNASYAWRVIVENAEGAALYTSNEKNSSTSSIDVLNVTSPTGLTDLLPGTYTVKLQVYQGGGNKYFTVPYLTFDATITDYEATKYTVTTSVNNENYGTVTETADYYEGTNVAITATPNTGFRFVSWTVDGAANASTDNPYTFANISVAHTIQAVFEAMNTVTFSKGDDAAVQGTAPAAVYADGEYTLPAAPLMYKSGYTLTAWNDGTADHAVGSKLTVNANVTLTPVYTQNAAELWTAGTAVTWDFRRANGTPDIQLEGNSGALVSRATIGATPYDAVMIIDATSGKFNNVGSENNVTGYAQINENTKLTIPALSGMSITFKCNQQPDAEGNVTFGGNNASAFDASAKTLTYTYTGDASTLNILVAKAGLYPEYVTVAYPSPYSVNYDANGGTGTVTDDNTYDANATVTTQANTFTRAGYAFLGWNTEADGSGTSVAAGSSFTITGNITLYAQWATGAEATITYTLNVSSTEDKTANTITSTDASTSTQLASLVGITNNTGGNYGTGDKANMTVKIPTDAEYNADHYLSVGFTVAEGYTFMPTLISVKAQPVSTNKAVKLVLTDGTNTIEKTQTDLKQGQLTTVTETNAAKTTLTGAVTLKIYCYGATDMYRLGSPIIIAGVVDNIKQNVTVAASGYTSIASAYALDFANAEDGEGNKNLTAFAVTSITKTSVTLTSVESAPAETGLILKGTASTAYSIPVTATPASVSVNELSAAVAATPVEARTVYAVSGGQLKLFTGTEVPAGKAYLLASKVPAEARGMALSFDEEELTGISNVDGVKPLLEGDFYNISGQRVAKPGKGMYIVNGKKVIVK